MNWDEIWNIKGSKDTSDILYLSGFSLHYNDLKITENHINLIIKNCKITKKDNILEVGCGAGRLAKYFIDNKYMYYGIEKSKNLVDKYKELTNNYNISLINNKTFPFNDKYFDVCFCYSVIQYLENDIEFEILLNEMKRVTKRVIFLGDIETINLFENNNKLDVKYEFDNNNLKHYILNPKYFDNYNKIIDNHYCSKESRYNVTILL
jgi:SAM-dependent methyltransferase